MNHRCRQMCNVAWFHEEEEEEAERHQATEKMSGGAQGRAKSAGRERMCDGVVGEDEGRETEREREKDER